MNSPVFTIGHSTHSTEKFLELLRLHDIEVLGDVRSSPYSRFNPQFNRETLQQSLKEQGLLYVFLGKELGARSEDKSCYESGRVRYDLLSRTALFQSGLERVIQGSARYRVALMCAEKEPLECHRTLLVARALDEKGVPVYHIHADGHLETHTDAMERLVELANLPQFDLFRSPKEILTEAMARQEAMIAYTDERMASSSVREEPQ
ncbi:MAG: DUF488 domain-containing protein [Bdellovibrionaceae bacterium]|nr:DUF488 domain-containing protein [Pseudobdellovibrionaceae bacterium]